MQKRERFINFRPVLLSALFLIFGILFSYSQYCGENAWWLLLVLAPPFFISFFAKKKLRATIYALVFCCCFFIGAGSFTLKMENYRDCGSYYGVYTVTGRVVETAKTDSGHKVLLSEVTIDGNTESGKLSAYLLSPYSDSLRLSDRVELKVFVRTDTAL